MGKTLLATWTAESRVTVAHIEAIQQRTRSTLRMSRRILPRAARGDSQYDYLRAAVDVMAEDVEALVREIERLEGRRA